MTSAADLPEEVYFCRWVHCDGCEFTIIVQGNHGKPVPDEVTWHERQCPVCGDSLPHWNADFQTIQDQERGFAKHRLPTMLRRLARACYNGAQDPWQELYDRGASPLLERVADAVEGDLGEGRDPMERGR